MLRSSVLLVSLLAITGCTEGSDLELSPSLSQVRYGVVLAEDLDEQVILPEARFIRGVTIGSEDDAAYPQVPGLLTPEQFENLADFEDDPTPLDNHTSNSYTRAIGDLYDQEEGRINFDDVKQGAIGDCYFVAALSAVLYADVDGRVRDSFIRPVRDSAGDPEHYAVRFYDYAGRPQDVEVDADLVRSGSGNPTYARSADSVRGDEEWAISLLEKAYAKWHGDYEEIGDGGSPGDVMQALTGSHSSYRRVKYLSDSSVLKTIRDGVAENRPLTALTYGEDDGVDYAGTGVYAWHAYTLMGARETEEGVVMVQLRNPWGSGEPADNGDDDGIFEITGETFRRLYVGIGIGGGLNPDTVAPNAVNDFATESQTDGAVVLTWTATGDDGRNGLAYRYDLRQSASPITADNFYEATTVPVADPQAPGSDETVEVTGLTNGAAAYFAIRIEDESGNVSGVSNVVTATPAPVNVELDPNAVVLDFESTHSNILEDGLFHLSSTHTVDGDTAMYCGDEASGTYDVSNPEGALYIAEIDLSLYAAPVVMWQQRIQTEQTSAYDRAWLEVSSADTSWAVVWERAEVNNGALQTITVDLSQFAGETIDLLFQFDANGDAANDYAGWMIDDITFTTAP